MAIPNRNWSPMKKIWWFIWEDDSIWSWIVNVILAFILIKFIVYPGLGFMLDTSHPIVAVVSGSMEHKPAHICIDTATTKKGLQYCNEYSDEYFLCGVPFDKKRRLDFDEYWEVCSGWYDENTNITKERFRDFRYRNGFNTGDIMILVGKEPKDLKIGDIIVYQSTRPDPIIHRVIDIWEEDGEYFFHTKGDHNSGSNGDEFRIREEQIIGKAIIRVPLLGWVKIWFVKAMATLGLV